MSAFNFELAKKKLPPNFDLNDLPSDSDHYRWDKLNEYYGLSMPESLALVRYLKENRDKVPNQDPPEPVLSTLQIKQRKN